MNLIHKEPTDKELRAFKRDFLKKKSQEALEPQAKQEIKDLLKMIGVLQSERDEAKYQLAECKKTCNSMAGEYRPKKSLIKEIRALEGLLKKANDDMALLREQKKANYAEMLADSLFLQLKFGDFYA